MLMVEIVNVVSEWRRASSEVGMFKVVVCAHSTQEITIRGVLWRKRKGRSKKSSRKSNE